MQIGHIIAKIRNEKKMSQRDLALALNLSPGVVGLWETDRRCPSLEVFIELIDYFAISADALLDADRKLTPDQYHSQTYHMSPETKKILDTFSKLNEDNKDILIGEAKKMLKNQRIEEKRRETPTAKAT